MFSFGSPSLRAMLKNQRGSSREHQDGQGPRAHAQRRQIEGVELTQSGKEEAKTLPNSNLQISEITNLMGQWQ